MEPSVHEDAAVRAPPKALAKRIAVIWIHGWGVNFYQLTYVMIGRALAERGYFVSSAAEDSAENCRLDLTRVWY